MYVMLAHLYSSAEFIPRFVKTYPGNAGCIIFLQRLIALVLLMCADAQITQPVIQRIQVDMVDFISLRGIYQIAMKVFSVSIHHIKYFPRQILIVAVEADTLDFMHFGRIDLKDNTIGKMPIGYFPVLRESEIYIGHGNHPSLRLF